MDANITQESHLACTATDRLFPLLIFPKEQDKSHFPSFGYFPLVLVWNLSGKTLSFSHRLRLRGETPKITDPKNPCWNSECGRIQVLSECWHQHRNKIIFKRFCKPAAGLTLTGRGLLRVSGKKYQISFGPN